MADTRIRALGLGNPPVGDLSLTPTPRPDKGFVEEMKAALGRVNKLQMEANQAIQDLATGRRKSLHETMIQVEKAEISFQLMMAVRRKLLAAYQEIMRMHF